MTLTLPARTGRRPANPEGQMSLTGHLRELRRRLVISLLAVASGAVAGWYLYPQILHLLEQPYCGVNPAYRYGGSNGGGCVLVYHGVVDGFMTHLKVAAISGAVLTAPVWLYQIWAFITPGLHKNERRYTVAFVGASTILFATGAALAYLVLGKAMDVLLHQGGGTVQAMLTINGYLSFVTVMLLVFGLSFELPLLVVMANLVGVLPAALLRRTQRIAIFLIVVFAGIVVPSTDPFSMLAMAIPMIALYEGAVLIAILHDRRTQGSPVDVAVPTARMSSPASPE